MSLSVEHSARFRVTRFNLVEKLNQYSWRFLKLNNNTSVSLSLSLSLVIYKTAFLFATSQWGVRNSFGARGGIREVIRKPQSNVGGWIIRVMNVNPDERMDDGVKRGNLNNQCHVFHPICLFSLVFFFPLIFLV